MKAIRCCFLAVLAAPSAEAANPVAKVVELLSGLEAKITAEGEQSNKVYSDLVNVCDDKSKDIGFAISTSQREAGGLKAAITKEDSKIDEFGSKIEGLVAAIADADADLKAAEGVRSKEAADFAAEEKELLEVINTLERAVGILEKELRSGSSAAMLQMQSAKGLTQALQAMVQASVLSTADVGRLTALAQTADSDDRAESQADDAALGAPDAAVYKSHAGGIVETLNGLLDQAHDQLGAARKKETTSAHNFEMLQQSLVDEGKFSNKDLAESKKGLSTSREAKASAERDLQETSKSLATDENDLSTLKEYCSTAAADFSTEQKTRAEELDALKQAIATISEAGGAAAKTYTALLQRVSANSNKGFEAARFLRGLAHGQDGSAELAQLASRVSSTVRLAARMGSDPFSKVKGLIADMIVKLEKEAGADATHKAYCDKEMKETASSLREKSTEVDKLSTRLDKQNARSAVLKGEIATAQKELADLAASQAEMGKVRSEEKAVFDETKPELEAGIKAVQAGMKILKDYYASKSGAVTSILGFLEVIESDFSKGLVEKTAAEDSAQSAYEKMTQENEISKTSKEQDVTYKTKEMTTLAKDAAATSSDREGVQTELDSVTEYSTELDKMCVAKPETYKAKAAKRAAELAGLKEALQILDSEAGLLQQGSLRGVKLHA